MKDLYNISNLDEVTSVLLWHKEIYEYLKSNVLNDRSNARISNFQILNTLRAKGSVKIFSEQFKSFITGLSTHNDNEERLFVCKCN